MPVFPDHNAACPSPQNLMKRAAWRIAIIVTYFFLFYFLTIVAVSMLPPSTDCEICLRNGGGPCDDDFPGAGVLLMAGNFILFCRAATTALDPKVFLRWSVIGIAVNAGLLAFFWLRWV